MISRKQRARLNQVLNVALVALVLNIVVPVRAHAKTTEVPTTGNSHSVIVQPLAPSVPVSSLTTLPTIPDKPIIVKKTLTVRSSAYSSTVDQTDSDPFTTASGAKVHDGTVAANGLPFGTKIRIPQYFGDKVFVVEDRMNAKWGTKKIDVWMPTRTAALQWGVRTVAIEIIS